VEEYLLVVDEGVVLELELILFEDADQDDLDDFVAEIQANTFSRADSESPESIAVLGSGQTVKSIGTEGVTIATPYRRCTVQVVRIDDDGRLGWDIVTMNDFGIVSNVREGESDDRFQPSRLEVGVVEEGIVFSNIRVSPFIWRCTKRFVLKSILDLPNQTSLDVRVLSNVAGSVSDGRSHDRDVSK